ncbi:MAG: lipid II:glycine glycyltransferase FemX [Candidatus Gracilibacteria bacterium]
MTELIYKPLSTLTASQKKEWQLFIESIPETKGFLYQNLVWADFIKTLIPKDGIGLYLLREKHTGQILIGSMGYRYPLLRRKYWLYFSRGPLFQWKDREYLKTFFEEVKRIEKDAVWIRFDPAIAESSETVSFFSYAKAHKSFHPKKTLVLDLTPTKDEILAQMHSKGRYNIRLAEKKGVEVFGWEYKDQRLTKLSGMEYTDELIDPVGLFSDMIYETGKRDGFSVHSREYFENFLRTLGSEHAFLLLSKHGDEWIGGGIFTYTSDACIYYYGASLHQYRQLMAPYLVQWKAITYAKEVLGSKIYDFLGIGSAENDAALAGVTEFKRKFGGQERGFVGTFEIRVKPMWFLLVKIAKFLKKIRKIKR